MDQALVCQCLSPVYFDLTKKDSQSKDVGSKIRQAKQLFLSIWQEYTRLIHIGPSISMSMHGSGFRLDSNRPTKRGFRHKK